MLTTTLNKIRQCHPWPTSWEKLLKSLGKTEADDEPITLEYILESNGLDDALWVLRAVDGYEGAKRLLACNYAEPVLPLYEVEYPSDKRPRLGIETSRRFAWVRATEAELKAASAAASAAYDDIIDAWYDAYEAACSAALDAAGEDASNAAYDAAGGAASAIARSAASYAEWAIARAAQADEFLKFCHLEGEYGEVSGDLARRLLSRVTQVFKKRKKTND